MTPQQLAELQQLLDGLTSMNTPATTERADVPIPEASDAPQAVEDPPAATLELNDYDELEAEEIIALLGSLDRPELEALRALESDSRSRASVLHAIDSVLARAPA